MTKSWKLCLPRALLLLTMLGPRVASADADGPTIHFRNDAGEPSTNAVLDFMYFVPLISLSPVTSTVSPGATLAVRVVSSTRRASGHSFTATCEIEMAGQGTQQNIFDLGPNIRRHMRQLQESGLLAHQLKSIDIQGAGAITVEVKGTVTNNVSTVNEVRLHFNARSHSSPVSIDLCDIRGANGNFHATNEMLARVNMLTFRRKSGPPTMDVSVASVKHKEAGDGFWQNLKGDVAGMAANMLIPPLKIEPVGQEAMLNFGQALASGASSFTFPLARNLRAAPK